MQANSFEFFNANKMVEGGQPFVDPQEGVIDCLEACTKLLLGLRHLQFLTLDELHDLCLDVVHAIAVHACTRVGPRVATDQPYKLTPQVLNNILTYLVFLKHDHNCMYDAFTRNWAKSALNEMTSFLHHASMMP